VVKTQALARKVWEYIDPSQDQVPTLKEPNPPTPKDVNQEISAYGQLSADEKEEYRILRQDYRRQLDLYDKRESALSSLRAYIQSSVSRTCLFYTFGTVNACEMLIELQKRLQPTDQLRELNLSNRYQGLRIAPKSQDLTSRKSDHENW
jgi:hypothetical protein